VKIVHRRGCRRVPAAMVARVAGASCAVLLVAAGLARAVGLPGTAAGSPPAQTAPTAQTVPDDLFELMIAGRMDRLLALAGEELDSPDVPVARKLDLLRALATVHLAEAAAGGDATHRESARAAMVAMLKLDPQADFVPGHRYPPPVHALFRQVSNEMHAGAEVVADPRRVAVAPFYLIDMGAGAKFNWSDYCAALPYMITGDLEDIPGLIVLSREHMDAIRGELALSSQADLVSAENRIRLKRLLSASSFVYGEVQALPGDEIWLEVRWVQTESGSVLVARHDKRRIRKGADLLALEQDVILGSFIPAMLEGLGYRKPGDEAASIRDDVQRKMAQAAKGDTYLHYVAAVARATVAEQAGNLGEALAQWHRAETQLPDNAAPGERIRALKLFYGGAESDSLPIGLPGSPPKDSSGG
jgi:hypothetical protein